MRLAVLWSELSGFTDACLKAASQSGAALFVAYRKPVGDAPYDPGQFRWIPKTFPYDSNPDPHALHRAVSSFAPDVVLASSWNIRVYRKLLPGLDGKALRVLCMDNPWRGTIRQYLGCAIAGFYLRPLYDAAFVAGERQAVFARKLGFAEDSIWRGVLSCDHRLFSDARLARGDARRHRFVYVGRLVAEKGVDTLAAAYRRYRAAAADPWPLTLCGTGPLASLFDGVPGVDCRGFVQPEFLPGIFGDSECLVLPSRFEPWGVVLHEAAAAGLPAIATTEVGAGVHLLQDRYSGYVVAPGDDEALAAAMARFAALDDLTRARMGDNAAQLARQFTPERWAARIAEGYDAWRARS